MPAAKSAYSQGQDLTINGRTIARGSRQVVRVPVYTDLDGSEIALFIHAIVGAQPGPVLAIHTALHGSEWQPIEAVRQVVEGLDPSSMRGALLALPVGNPVALSSRTRNLRDESDSPDLNRSFGGEQTWIADQLARSIAEHVLKHADALIDFHCGIWGSTMGSVTCGQDFSDADVNAASFALARAYGHPYVRLANLITRFPGPRSSVGYSGEVLKVPNIIAEIGGAGFDPETEERWLQANVKGIRGVMQHLGIIAGTPAIPENVLVSRKAKRVNPANAGLVEPVFPAEEMMTREVQEGELLGRVISPYTLEVIEELRAPYRGLVDMAPRLYPARPGDWAYLVLPLDDPDTKWIGPNEAP